MWAQYRKTFWPMQAMILLVALAVYFGLDRLFARAAIFWIVMQVAAVIGAFWAVRLKTLVQRGQSRLPLQKRA